MTASSTATSIASSSTSGRRAEHSLARVVWSDTPARRGVTARVKRPGIYGTWRGSQATPVAMEPTARPAGLGAQAHEKRASLSSDGLAIPDQEDRPVAGRGYPRSAAAFLNYHQHRGAKLQIAREMRGRGLLRVRSAPKGGLTIDQNTCAGEFLGSPALCGIAGGGCVAGAGSRHGSGCSRVRPRAPSGAANRSHHGHSPGASRASRGSHPLRVCRWNWTG